MPHCIDMKKAFFEGYCSHFWLEFIHIQLVEKIENGKRMVSVNIFTSKCLGTTPLQYWTRWNDEAEKEKQSLTHILCLHFLYPFTHYVSINTVLNVSKNDDPHLFLLTCEITFQKTFCMSSLKLFLVVHI